MLRRALAVPREGIERLERLALTASVQRLSHLVIRVPMREAGNARQAHVHVAANYGTARPNFDSIVILVSIVHVEAPCHEEKPRHRGPDGSGKTIDAASKFL